MSFLPNPHAPGCPWHNACEQFGAPNLKWCEESLCSWISEPANAWSNMAYIIGAIVIYFWTRKSEQKSIRYLPFAMFLMGAGSFIYHISNNYLTQIVDFLGMYIFVYWLMAINMLRLNWLKNIKQAILVYLVLIILNTAILHVMYLMGIKFQILVAVAAILIGTLEYLAAKKSSSPIQFFHFILGAALIIVAETFSLLDLNRIICDPTNHWFQGHALWHTLGAIGLTIGVKHWMQFKFKE